MKMTIKCNELLGRPLLKIYQDPDAFQFSIDSMLLADFVSITARTKNVCDLCSGNAPIPLYLTLRTKANIVGVEIQKESYDLGLQSILENHLENQIKLYCDNAIGISSKIGQNCFEVVTCNPPFFKLGSHQINPSDRKAIARHEITATLEDFIKEASILLNTKGRFALVHRPDRLVEILELFHKYHLEPKRLRFVYPKLGSPCNHILIEGIKDGSAGGLIVLPPLIVYHDDDKWTKEVLKIYNFEE
ncbi:MAG: tRNA1(Val) (adenine(37)-N6)-methyltransferase [Anaeroplasmataceae bacterium]|nr:tRNA1(Val) (adenine(37)-N6)-methyltransferase [Anaeroplasmataceae bacterium]